MAKCCNGTKCCKGIRNTMGGPNVKLFQRFGECWSSVDKTRYEIGLDIDFIALALTPVRDGLTSFNIN